MHHPKQYNHNLHQATRIMNVDPGVDKKKCIICGSTSSLNRCSRCKVIFYCSKEHQKKDWNRHKSECAPFNYTQQQQVAFDNLDQILLPTIGGGGNNSDIYTTIVGKPLVENNAMPISAKRPRMQAKDFPQITFNHNSTDYFNNRQLTTRLEEIVQNVVQDMNDYGLCLVDNFMGPERGSLIRNEVTQMYTKGIFRNGQLVSNKGDNTKTIRGDQITWIDGKEEGCQNIAYMIQQVDLVLMKANKMRNNGKLGQYNINGRTMAMVACYPGHGSHYVKHVDNPNQDGRCITAIYYLNLDWSVQDYGGLLRIFPDGCSVLNDKVADIEPIFDRLIFFWSDRRNPHEVQPAYRTRYAITLWYFDSKEREEACRKDEQNSLAKKHYDSS